MPFESGSMSFRMIELPRAFPKNWVEKFAAERAGDLSEVGDGRQIGWVTGRHLLDSNITEETAMHGGWIRLTLRVAERKIPRALLRAECRMEELSRQAADGKAYRKPKERAEIRKAVEERLLPTMPPQLKAIPFIYKPGETHLFASALPESQLDVFGGALRAAVGFHGEAAGPVQTGLRLKGMDLREVRGASFSPEMANVAMEAAPGREFLTWLWFKADTQNGSVALESTGQSLGVLVEGPLTFAYEEGEGALVSVLKKGMPESSVEAKSSLLGGKKLKECKITFALDEQLIWSFQFSADEFLVRGLKVPQSEGRLDAISRFQERMIFLEQWREMFLDLFGAYLVQRTDAKKWKRTLGEIREWVQTRNARR